jgi:outer membrane lipoprotein
MARVKINRPPAKDAALAMSAQECYILTMKRISLAIALALLLSGCVHAMSQESVRKSVKNVPFSEVASNTFFYEGKLFIWGGIIVGTTLTEEGTFIEVVQTPLNRYGVINDTDVSEGRFLVRSRKFLDPLIYEEGRYITVAGVLKGSEKRPLGKTDYVYPVLEAKELYLWKEEVLYPPYYDPWYYRPRYRHRYYCDPFWDPWCPYP